MCIQTCFKCKKTAIHKLINPNNHNVIFLCDACYFQNITEEELYRLFSIKQARDRINNKEKLTCDDIIDLHFELNK